MKRLALIALLLAVNFSFAQPAFVKDSLDIYIEKGMKLWKIPGMSVAIVKDGKVVHIKGYGVTDMTTKQPVNESTLFMIGSNTKLFTATALAMLEQEKKLSLDDKVTKWIPYFKLNDPLAGDAAIVKDLLSHRLGFETFQGDFTYWASNLSREDVVTKMALVEAPYGFRTKWGYCNAAFVAAGEVVQAVSGDTWENYIRKSILAPLKMNDTRMLVADLPAASNIAKPYTLVEDKLVKLDYAQIDNLAPAGTMTSSAKDMINWVITQAAMGEYEGKQVIPRGAITATRQPQSIMGVDHRNSQNTHFYVYALGAQINDKAGKVVVSHTGGVDGFLSSVTIVPEEKLGIVVLTNTDANGLYQALNSEILDAYLNLPYTGYSYKAITRTTANRLEEKKNMDSLKALVTGKSKSTVPLATYAGDYTNKLYGDVSVKLENKKLVIHFSHHPQLTGVLDLINDGSFLCTYNIPTYGIKAIPFHMSNGKVTGFTLTVADFVEFTPYEFVRKD